MHIRALSLTLVAVLRGSWALGLCAALLLPLAGCRQPPEAPRGEADNAATVSAAKENDATTPGQETKEKAAPGTPVAAAASESKVAPEKAVEKTEKQEPGKIAGKGETVAAPPGQAQKEGGEEKPVDNSEAFQIMGIQVAPEEQEAADEQSASPNAATPPPGPGALQVINLSLRQALLSALKDQAAIAVARFDPQIDEKRITEAKAEFDPSFFTDGTYTDSNRPTGSKLESGLPTITQKGPDVKMGFRGKLPTGTAWEMSGRRASQSTNSTFAVVNPQQITNFSLSVRQSVPFLGRGGSYEANMSSIYIARTNYRISLQNFRRTVLDSALKTAQGYWVLHYRYADLALQEESLHFAEKVLSDEERRLKMGMSAKLDVIQGEKEVAAQHQAVIEATSELAKAIDDMKLLMKVPDELMARDISIRPIDEVTKPIEIPSLDDALAEALVLRPELIAKREELEARKIVVKYSKNQMLPVFDLKGTLEYNGLTGNATTSMDEVTDRDFKSWTLGTSIEIPIGNRAARNAYERSQLEQQKTVEDMKRVEQETIMDVRNSHRSATTAGEKILAAQAEVRSAEQQLRVQESKHRVGRAKTSEVLEAQRDLKMARTKEIQARVEHLVAVSRLATSTTLIFDLHGIEIMDDVLKRAEEETRKTAEKDAQK